MALRLAAASSLLFTYSCKSPEEVQRSVELRASRPFIEQLERTNACPGCDIKWADFTGKNFAGADLRGAHLLVVVAPDSNFRGANLTGGALVGNLQRADLRDMVFQDGSLRGDLDGADLRGSIFSGRADLAPSHARGARFDGLDLRKVGFPESGDWSGASLRGADLRGLVMNGFTGSYERVEGDAWRLQPGHGGSRWAGADLRDADLRGTNFNRCDLSNADLRGALLQGARLSANLQGAQLSLDSLADADFGAATWIDGTTCDSFKSIGKCVPFAAPSSNPTQSTIKRRDPKTHSGANARSPSTPGNRPRPTQSTQPPITSAPPSAT